MTPDAQFDELLQAVEGLPDDAQAELIDVISRRLAERGRKRVARDVQQARREFADGKCAPTTPDQLLGEIES